MNIMDLFEVGVEGDRVYVTCDRDHIDDLCTAAETLMKLGKIMRMKAAVARASEEKKAQAAAPVRRVDVFVKAEAVFQLYEKHLNNGCAGDKVQAIKATAADLNLLVVDVRNYVRMHRKAGKEETYARRSGFRRDHKGDGRLREALRKVV